MPIRETTYKSALSSDLDDFMLSRRKKKSSATGADEGDVEFLSILEFIDKFKLLPDGLHPVQRFIVKMYYNIPLDAVNQCIVIYDVFNRDDMFGKQVLHRFTEVEYLKYLKANGRCNIEVQDGKERRELILVIGRRSGKSLLAAIFAAYEIYKLLRRGYPQSYYGMTAGSEIRILCVANDKEQASIVYGDVQSHVEAIDYFKSSVANATQTFMKFRTENDKKRFGADGKKATVNATFKSSIAKGLRGRGIICSILDEIAFFVDDGKSSAERVYKAINPSLAQFSPRNPKNKNEPIGPTEGRMIMISSPDAKEGFFYRQYQLAMAGGKAAENTLVIQAPTWEVNPTVDRSYYEIEFHKDEKSFMTEHGAEFSDRVRGWIENRNDLIQCIDPDLKPVLRGVPREVHFAGVDVGLMNDGTAIALTKIAGGKVVLAYHEVWYAKKRWRDSNPHLAEPLVPYALSLQDRSRLDLDQISLWFKAVAQRFYISRGVFDQWSGIVFEQELHKNGLHQFEMRNFFSSDSSKMYQDMKTLMYARQLSLYDWPRAASLDGIEGTRRSPIIEEMLELQATSGGKNLMIVEAPKAPGKHDDMSDSLARSVMLALEYVKDHPGALDSSHARGGLLPQARSPGYDQYHNIRRRLHGGKSALRVASRKPPRR